jgi:hypothetical protein
MINHRIVILGGIKTIKYIQPHVDKIVAFDEISEL